jgi:predicted nucleic acid-binding protein
MLLDSNIIIYAAMPEYNDLRQLIRLNAPKVSAISHIEVLGYHKLNDDELMYFDLFFNHSTIIPIDNHIVKKSILLKQQQKISLGDAVIAATALEHNLRLVTRNTKDFDWINGLNLLNPIDDYKK